MKTIASLIHLFFILISFNTIAQNDKWTTRITFDRFFINEQKKSDLYLNDTNYSRFSKKAYINSQNQKIIEIAEYHNATDQMIPVKTGTIENLKIKTFYSKDSTLYNYHMEYDWKAKDLRNGSISNAKVKERIFYEEYSDILLIDVDIRYDHKDENIYAWYYGTMQNQTIPKDIILPQLLKIYRIGYQEENSESSKYLSNPEELVCYALWTNNGFYRYAKNGLKDKVIFSKMEDSINTTPYNTMISYNDKSDRLSMYMNNYSKDDPQQYISTLDINPFPLNSDEPVIQLEEIIIWEKENYTLEFTRIELMLEYIEKKGFSQHEIKDMENKLKLLIQILNDISNEN